jgi:NAD(P)-dependent dehydrogenase (short-subunit alcohol dehydrogenase family)
VTDWNIENKLCLITGATSGIGQAAAVELARKGAHVVFTARDERKRDELLAELRRVSPSGRADALFGDLSSMKEVRRIAASFKERFDRLDVLVNNAGAIFPNRELTAEGFEQTFALNHLSYFLLTRELLDVLRASAPARIVNVASRAHQRGRMHFDDLQLERDYGAWRAYGQSKLANVLFTRELARRLEGSGITANCMHPGVVSTGFGKSRPGLTSFLHRMAAPFLLTPEQGADTLIWLASSKEVQGRTGGYYVKRHEVAPSRAARDPEAARRLWDASERLVDKALGQ